MKINSIELKNFRNYTYCSIEFDPFINIFIGKNAQGKTNLLEAIYILSMSKSFKTKVIDEMICYEKDFVIYLAYSIYICKYRLVNAVGFCSDTGSRQFCR